MSGRRELPQVWAWNVWNSGGGLPEARAHEAFGGGIPLKGFAELKRQARQFGAAFNAHVIGHWGSDSTARSGFPEFWPRVTARHATLLQAQDGTWFPIATHGPGGWLALTESESIAAVRAVAPDAGPGPKTQTQVQTALTEAGVRPPGPGFEGESMTVSNTAGEGVVDRAGVEAPAMAGAAVKTVAGVATAVGLRYAFDWLFGWFTGRGPSNPDAGE